jgi:hypothetical protein
VGLLNLSGKQKFEPLAKLKDHSMQVELFKRTWIILVLSALIASCNIPHRQGLEVEEADFGLIARAAFKLIDPKEEIKTIVVPAGTDPRARKALAGMHTVISPAQVPKSSTYVLPQGYFLLQSFTIENGEASLEGQVGPVTRALTAIDIPDCGKIYAVPFYLEGDAWIGRTYKVTDCSQSRHWVPVDEMKKAE